MEDGSGAIIEIDECPGDGKRDFVGGLFGVRCKAPVMRQFSRALVGVVEQAERDVGISYVQCQEHQRDTIPAGNVFNSPFTEISADPFSVMPRKMPLWTLLSE